MFARTVPQNTLSPQTGFTLFELLVVIAILALLSALLPHLTRKNPGFNVRAAARALGADLRLLRNEAVRTANPTELVIKGNAYTLSFEKGTRFGPNGVSFRYVASEPDLLQRPADRLKFYDDGSSSGGQIIVQAGKIHSIVEVNWLDGAVIVREE
jgi:general secretion pathway protein H